MRRIITGSFRSKDRAGEVRVLLERYLHKADIFIFSGNSPGQPGALVADKQVVGERHAFLSGHGSFLLSVRVSNPENEVCVITILQAEGALNIEPSEGEWLDGEWVDFDPMAAAGVTKTRGAKKAIFFSSTANTIPVLYAGRFPTMGRLSASGNES